jgi:hypothetical protein
MIKQPSKWLAVALVGGVFVAGCGSSSSSSSSSASSSTSAPSSETTATTSSTPATTSTSSTSTPSGAVSAAVAECKSAVKLAPTLSSSVKAKIEGVCAKAATDPQAARQAAKEVCVEVINASPIPAGVAKEHALAGCKSGH